MKLIIEHKVFETVPSSHYQPITNCYHLTLPQNALWGGGLRPGNINEYLWQHLPLVPDNEYKAMNACIYSNQELVQQLKDILYTKQKEHAECTSWNAK